MADAALPIQRAIYARLTGSVGGSPAVAVYDHAPLAGPFPYLTIGEDTAVDDGTKTERGQQTTVTIHGWSRAQGRAEVKALMADVYDLLHEASFTVTGQTLVRSIFEYGETLLDPDGMTYHSVQRFRLTTQPT